MKTLISGAKAGYSVHILEDTNRFEILRKLGEELYRSGFVKQSYIEAVCRRENEYPTGLPTSGVGIAIPHADVQHVNNEAMIVGVLREPVIFQVMGSQSDLIKVQLVFMLAIKDSHAQLEMLQRLIEGCQDEQVLFTLRDCKDTDAMERILMGFMAQ